MKKYHKQKCYLTQTLTLKRAWYRRWRIAWGLSCARRWLLWALNTPSCVKHASSVHRILCTKSLSAACWHPSHSQNIIRRGRACGNVRSGGSGVDAADRREVLRVPCRLGYSQCLCDIAWADQRPSFHGWDRVTYIVWCAYGPWATCGRMCRRCYTCVSRRRCCSRRNTSASWRRRPGWHTK
jgi:hypothetical protein